MTETPQHLDKSSVRCPHPRKRAYADKASAELHNAAGDLRLRAYCCRCGAWHLTKSGAIVIEPPAKVTSESEAVSLEQREAEYEAARASFWAACAAYDEAALVDEPGLTDLEQAISQTRREVWRALVKVEKARARAEKQTAA